MNSLRLRPPATLPSTHALSFRGFSKSCYGCRTFGLRAGGSGSGQTSPRRAGVPFPGDDRLTFEDLGIPTSVLSSLRKAYPNVHQPTATQGEYVPAILNGMDVLLKENTGSGKSFGILLALLSKRRIPSTDIDDAGEARKHPRITSLLIVPHRDLAYQYLHWAERIHAGMNSSTTLPSFAQVVVRNAANPISEQIRSIRSAPPHVLIGTPQALCDVLEQDEEALILRRLSTVVVDEADYLIQSLPRGKDKYATLKARRVMNRHPSPTRQILDKIYMPYRPSYERGVYREVSRRDQKDGYARPQLILSSATLRVHLRNFVIREGGWLTKERGRIANVTGKDFSNKEAMEDKAENTIGGPPVLHYALVISEHGGINNITGAGMSSDEEAVSMKPNAAAIHGGDVDASKTPQHSPPVQDIPEPSGKPPPLHILEAVGEAFALDVPRLALLVLPASAPLVQVVDELRRLGVNAEGLDVVRGETGRAYMTQESSDGVTETPVLLVATLASMRGLDLPELTHVFIVGVAKDSQVDSYLHAAGRVGRFGRSGKVISVLEARHAIVQDKGVKGWKDEPKRMLGIFKRIAVRPRRFEHFN